MAGLDCDRDFGILDAERELIAAILMDNRAYRTVSHLLRPEHFLSPSHRRQFAAIAAAIEAGRRADRRTVRGLDRPMAVLPRIDPLDHALMIYGSFLGREAIGMPVPDLAPTLRAS